MNGKNNTHGIMFCFAWVLMPFYVSAASYDPFNPNPTQWDVDQARREADSARRAADDLGSLSLRVSGSDWLQVTSKRSEFERKAEEHSWNAERLEDRMWENQRQEERRRQEEEWQRQQDQRRQEEEWQRQEEGWQRLGDGNVEIPKVANKNVGSRPGQVTQQRTKIGVHQLAEINAKMAQDHAAAVALRSERLKAEKKEREAKADFRRRNYALLAAQERLEREQQRLELTVEKRRAEGIRLMNMALEQGIDVDFPEAFGGSQGSWEELDVSTRARILNEWVSSLKQKLDEEKRRRAAKRAPKGAPVQKKRPTLTKGEKKVNRIRTY